MHVLDVTIFEIRIVAVKRYMLKDKFCRIIEMMLKLKMSKMIFAMNEMSKFFPAVNE